MVSELERLSRSAADLGRIVEWIEELDGQLVAIDLRLDTGSAQGRLTARTLVADRLDAEGVPTLRGGSEWRPSSVQAAAGHRRPKGRKSNLKDPPRGERSDLSRYRGRGWQT